jgi:hypothetical protein
MSRGKPTLEFNTRTDAVLALRAQRLSTAAIADGLGIAVKTVTALEHSAGRARRAPRRAEELCRTVLFPVEVLDALGPHAARRGLHPNHLARLIVETVLDDGLVDAVLDDDAMPAALAFGEAAR